MKVKYIEVNYGITRNLGNYESLRLDYKVGVEINGDEAQGKLDELRLQLRAKVDKAVKEEIEWDSSRM